MQFGKHGGLGFSHVTDKRKKAIIFAVVIFLMTYCLVQFFGKMGDSTPAASTAVYTGKDISSKYTDELFSGDEIRQSFISNDDEIAAVSVKVATYRRINSCDVRLRVFGEDGVLLGETSVDCSDAADNRFFKLEFENSIENVGGKKLELSFTSDGTAGNAISFWTTGTDYYTDGELRINEKRADVDIAFMTSDSDNSTFVYLAAFYVISYIILALAVFWVIFFFEGASEKRRNIFLVGAAAALGLIYMLTITPLSPPDSDYHVNSAYILSNRLLLRGTNEFEAEVLDFSAYTQHYNTTGGYEAIIDGINVAPGYSGEKVMLNGRYDSLRFPIMYLAPAIGVSAARLLHLNGVLVFFAGRFCNFLLYVVMLYFSLKIVPKRMKLPFFIIAVFPMTLQQVVSYSYDSYINSLAIFLTASLLSAIFGEGKLKTGELVRIAVAGVLLAPAKLLYIFILALAFLIPAERFEIKKKRWLTLMVICGAAAAAMLCVNIVSIINTADGIHGIDVGATYTLSYFFEHPFISLRIYITTLSRYFVGYLFGSVGRALSGLTLVCTSDLAIYGFVIILILSGLRREGEAPLYKKNQKLIAGGAVFVMFTLVLFSMFICWTPFQYETVEGVQGRYFIPILFTAATLSDNGLLVLRKNTDKFVLGCAFYFEFLVINSTSLYMLTH